MAFSVPGEVVDMVGVLAGERLSPAWGSSVASVASRIGVAPVTLGRWESLVQVPSLGFMVRWAALFNYRLTLTDYRDRRWDKGVVHFGPSHWGNRPLLDAFAGAESGRLVDTLRRAREAWGLSIWDPQLSAAIGCRSTTIVYQWETSRVTPRMEYFVRWAGQLGLCPSLQLLDELPDQAPDDNLAALKPEDEMRRGSWL